MSLGKRLRNIHNLDSTGHLDLLSSIDRVLTENAEDRPFFSIRLAKSAVLKLQRALDTGDRKEYLVAFAYLSSVMYAPEAVRKGKVHPSSLFDDCERRMYFEMSDEVPTNVKPHPDARLQRIFDLGTWVHSYLQVLMLKSGDVDEIEARVLSLPLEIDGRADAVTVVHEGKQYVVEIKTCNSRVYSNIQRSQKPLDKHVDQATIYASVLGIEWILFLYFNKDTQEMLQLHIKVDPKVFNLAKRKIQGVQQNVSEKTPPPAICSTKYSERARSCEYCDLCFSN